MSNILLLDGPAAQAKLVVTDSTPVEVKAGSTILDDRQSITLQGSGKFYVYFAEDSSTPTATTVENNGFWQYKNVKESYEAGGTQKVWLMSVTGTIDIVVCERA
jgi:hypothetical protein